MIIKIIAISEWKEDDYELENDCNHADRSEVLHLLADETKAKKEDDSWTTGLPFTYKAESNNEDDAIDEALEAYTEQFCQFDLLKPEECDYEVEDND